MSTLSRWPPAILLMAAIFVLSARTPSQLPVFGDWDRIIKKAGHAVGYGLLAAAYHRAIASETRRPSRRRPRASTVSEAEAGLAAPLVSPSYSVLLAWLLAVIYGLSDELHQSFVPGRSPSAWDVILFDAPGGACGLWLKVWLSRRGPKANRRNP